MKPGFIIVELIWFIWFDGKHFTTSIIGRARIQMANLRQLREGWSEIEDFETQLLRKPTIQEKVRDFLALLNEFGQWNDRTEADYAAEREEALVALQRRLQRLDSQCMTDETRD